METCPPLNTYAFAFKIVPKNIPVVIVNFILLLILNNGCVWFKSKFFDIWSRMIIWVNESIDDRNERLNDWIIRKNKRKYGHNLFIIFGLNRFWFSK